MIRKAASGGAHIVLVQELFESRYFPAQKDSAPFALARDFEGEVRNMEPEKCGELVWASFDHAPQPRVPYVEAAFRAWRGGVAYVEFGWEEQSCMPHVS